MRGAIVIATLALALTGCGKPIQPGAAAGQDRQEAQAREALARWDAAVAAAGSKAAFVPVGHPIGQIGDWEPAVGDNNKLALLSGQVEIMPDLPVPPKATGTIAWADGRTSEVTLVSATQALDNLIAGTRQDCGGCMPLKVTGARLSTMEVQTSRGMATVPAWEYSLRGTAVKITYPAAEPGAGVTVSPPPWDPYNAPAGLSIDGASVSADGLRLTVTFTGAPKPASEPCGADYTARVVESAHAVVVIVDMHPHAPNETCTMIGAPRTAQATLDKPLAQRVVLEVRQGLPVPVSRRA